MKLLPLITISSIALAGLINTAQANNFNYNYIEGGYSSFNQEGLDGAFDIGGSYDVADNINIIANFAKTDIEGAGIEGDITDLEVGIGYHTPIADETDLTADLTYIKAEAEVNHVSEEDTGYGIGVGVRHKFSNEIEGKARISHKKFDEAKSTALTVGGLYNINEALSAGLDLTTETDEGPEVIRTSLRWNML